MKRRDFSKLLLTAVLPATGAHRPSQKVVAIKCVVVGSPGVGKTSMLISYTTNAFSEAFDPAISDNYSKELMIAGHRVHLGLWDTDGSESFDRLRPLSYAQTDIFIVCYSVEQQRSFDEVRRKWASELRQHAANAPFMLLGCKADLRDDPAPGRGSKGAAVVTTERGRELAREIGAGNFLECSALTQIGLTRVFESATRGALARRI